MNKQLLLSFFIFIFVISCTKTVTETITKTVVEKEIVYLQKVNDTLLKVNLPKDNVSDFYQFKILKHDTIFYDGKDTLSRKHHFDKFDSIYKIKATFKNKHIQVGSHDEYIENTEIKNVTYTNPLGRKSGYILKSLSQRYKNNVGGITGNKHNLQFFRPQNTHNPAYELNYYTDALQIYEQESYFLTTIFGCCTSLPEYELYDLKGNFIFHSNNLIKLVKTEYNHYLIGALKNEVFDSIILVILDKNNSKQYVSLSDEIHNYNCGQNFQLKIKKKKQIEKGDYDKPLETYNLKSLDDLEIWIPFGIADTLKIPFKNEKVFGIDYPQLKVTLQDKTP